MKAILSCALGAWLLLIGSAQAAEWRLDAKALLARSTSEHVRLTRDGQAVELARGVLYEDDGPAAGYSYQPNVEKLSKQVWIKKELNVTDPRGAEATLLVGPGGELQAVINGKPRTLEPKGKAGKYWQTYSLPPDSLRKGKNSIVLHGAGSVWIARDDDFASGSRTRTRHPNRSAKSTDAGKTWDDARLGTTGNVDGEYYVRIFLDQHVPKGSLTLPVIDTGNLRESALAAPAAPAGPVRIHVDANAGKQGRIEVRVRSGPTPVPDKTAWSGWHSLGADGGDVPKHSAL